MAQYQIPGGAYANETTSNQAQVPGSAFLNETSGGGGPVAYTLTCAAGAYTYTGTAATLTVARNLSLAAGAYTYTGTAATLTLERKLALPTGAYTYTGNTAQLTVARNLALAPGAYTYAGNAATLTLGRNLALGAGAYTYTGNAATLGYAPGGAGIAYTLTCDAGAYTYTGNDATLTYAVGTAGTKSGVSRLWLIEYYTKAFAEQEKVRAEALPAGKAKVSAKKRKAEVAAKVEAAVAKAERDLDTLAQGVKDIQSAQAFIYNTVQQAQSQPFVEPVDFTAVIESYRKKAQQEDNELLLLAMVL